MRSARSWGAAALLVLSMVAGAPAALAAGPSTAPAATPLATPEDAARAYLAGVADANVDAIMATVPVDAMSSGFDFSAQVDRLQAMMLAQMPGPAEYPMFARMDQTQFQAQVLAQVRMLVYSLLSSEPMDGSVITPADQASAAAFVAQVDPSKLAGLQVIDVQFPNATLEHNDRYLANSAAMAAIYGADEATERVALISLGGQDFMVGFTLLRYGDQWGVSSQVSPLSGISALGAAQPTTQDEFDRVTTGG